MRQLSVVKQLVFLISFLVISSSSFAQNYALDAIGSIDYTYRILENQEIRDSYEKGSINARFGLDLNIALSPKLDFKTGLRYSTMSYKTNEEDTRWGSENINGQYTPDPLLPFSGTKEHQYQFLEIPFHLRYNLIKSKTSFYLEAGISANLNLEKKWLDRYEFNPLNVSANFAVGSKIYLTEKISLLLVPIFRYHLSKTLKDAINENLYSAGMELGIRYDLK